MFNGIWLVASEPLTIQGREVKAGERFHISRVHSGALLVQGRATILHPQPPPKGSVVAAPEPPPPPAKRRGRPRKTDVAAEVTTEVKTGIAPTAPADPPTVPEPAVPDVAEPELLIHNNIVEGNEAASIHVPPRRYQRRDLEADE